MISLLFIVVAVGFGFFVYRRNASLGVSTVIGVISIIICIAIGINYHPIYLSSNAWMIIIGIYILVASVTPVWILLQPRDYLSSFLLYGMMAIAVVGILGSHSTLDIPVFTGFVDTVAPTGTSPGYLFPALFVTIACGAMLVECALALIAVCAVRYIWKDYSAGTTVTPTIVFATGESIDEISGFKKTITNPYIATLITVALGIGLGLTGYANIWALFGAANQLLAALGLLAGGAALGWCYIRITLSVLLIILSIILMIEVINTIRKQFKSKKI